MQSIITLGILVMMLLMSAFSMDQYGQFQMMELTVTAWKKFTISFWTVEQMLPFSLQVFWDVGSQQRAQLVVWSMPKELKFQ